MRLLHTKVHPGARKDKIEKLADDRYEIWVKEPASGNRANRSVKSVVAKIADVPPNSVKMMKGKRSSFKTFIINSDEI